MKSVARRISDRFRRTVIEPHRAIAEIADLIELMGHEDQRDAAVLHLLNLGDALLRELFIADSKHLVDQQNLRIDMHRNGEAEANVHAGRVGFHRLIDEFTDARKFDDAIEAAVNLAPR